MGVDRPGGDPLDRVALAHHMADVCDDPAEELEWDLRALAAAGALTDTQTARGFYPSLHLNLGEDYRKLGDPAAAREHLALARARLDALCDDDYATGIRLALDGLADRLG